MIGCILMSMRPIVRTNVVMRVVVRFHPSN